MILPVSRVSQGHHFDWSWGHTNTIVYEVSNGFQDQVYWVTLDLILKLISPRSGQIPVKTRLARRLPKWCLWGLAIDYLEDLSQEF